RSCARVTETTPAAPPMLNSAMPKPLQSGPPSVFRDGSSVTSARPIAPEPFMDANTRESEPMMVERPPQAFDQALQGGGARLPHREAEPSRGGRKFFVLAPGRPDLLAKGVENIASACFGAG